MPAVSSFHRSCVCNILGEFLRGLRTPRRFLSSNEMSSNLYLPSVPFRFRPLFVRRFLLSCLSPILCLSPVFRLL